MEVIGASDEKDLIWIRVSLAGAFICALLLAFPVIFDALLGANADRSKTPVIGKISLAENDIRVRSSDSFSWEKAESQQDIRIGDSVFTGSKSRMRVAMADGGVVNLDQNSMVKFTQVDSIDVPNLALGNFKIAVNGKMKVAIAGEITELEGKGSELEVIVKGSQKPKIRLLKGSAKVASVKNDKTTTQNLKVIDQEAIIDEKPAPVVPLPIERPIEKPEVLALSPGGSYIHFHEMYDLYERQGEKISIRTAPRTLVRFDYPLDWSEKGPVRRVYVQLAQSDDFLNVLESFSWESNQEKPTLSKAALGKNYLRASVDGEHWDAKGSFEVQSSPLPGALPQISLEQDKLYILDQYVDIKGKVVSEYEHHLLEISEDSRFPVNNTRVEWLPQPKFTFRVSHAKTIYIRLRGVNQKQQLSDLSSPLVVNIEEPPLPLAPRLAASQYRIQEGENVLVNWEKGSLSHGYVLNVFDQQGELIQEQKISSVKTQVEKLPPGQYVVKVKSIDRFGRFSREASRAFVDVQKKPEPKPVLAEVERKPAKEAKLSEKLEIKEVDPTEKKYLSSRVSIEGGASMGYSTDQTAQNLTNSLFTIVGLKWLVWGESHGVQGSFRSVATDLSSGASAKTAPTDLEARYMYRWIHHLNPFGGGRPAEVSWILGYESYQNSKDSVFSPGYGVLKTGLGFSFLLPKRWSTGGEFLLGTSADAGSKYEISGFLNYFPIQQWSVGMGYRVQLFQSGNASTTPLGLLPYREGFGEGYSVLQWHY